MCNILIFENWFFFFCIWIARTQDQKMSFCWCIPGIEMHTGPLDFIIRLWVSVLIHDIIWFFYSYEHRLAFIHHCILLVFFSKNIAIIHLFYFFHVNEKLRKKKSTSILKFLCNFSNPKTENAITLSLFFSLFIYRLSHLNYFFGVMLKARVYLMKSRVRNHL